LTSNNLQEATSNVSILGIIQALSAAKMLQLLSTLDTTKKKTFAFMVLDQQSRAIFTYKFNFNWLLIGSDFYFVTKETPKSYAVRDVCS